MAMKRCSARKHQNNKDHGTGWQRFTSAVNEAELDGAVIIVSLRFGSRRYSDDHFDFDLEIGRCQSSYANSCQTRLSAI